MSPAPAAVPPEWAAGPASGAPAAFTKGDADQSLFVSGGQGDEEQEVVSPSPVPDANDGSAEPGPTNPAPADVGEQQPESDALFVGTADTIADLGNNWLFADAADQIQGLNRFEDLTPLS
jgi:hypothetical protein